MKKSMIIFGLFLLLLLGGLYYGFTIITQIKEGSESVEITVDAPANSYTNTQVAHSLLNNWLTHFTHRKYISAIRDFSFDSVTIVHEDPARNTFLVEASFSVMTNGSPEDSEWYGGAGGGSIDGQWIRGKVLRFQIIRKGDTCYLDVLG